MVARGEQATWQDTRERLESQIDALNAEGQSLRAQVAVLEEQLAVASRPTAFSRTHAEPVPRQHQQSQIQSRSMGVEQDQALVAAGVGLDSLDDGYVVHNDALACCCLCALRFC